MRKITTRVVVLVLAIAMVLSAFSITAFASIPNWEDNNVVFEGTSFGTNGYYNVISKKDYVLVPGAAVESEIVLNNASGTRRQVIHIIEVDPSNPDVSIVPGYHQIDKLAEDPKNEANWSHKELTEMAKYYEDNLGYNIVGGMNTDLYYSTYGPRVLVYNGKSIGGFGSIEVKEDKGDGLLDPTSSILYVFKDSEGNISCDVKAFNKDELDKYLAEGVLLHAVGVSFGMVVKDGELVSKTEERTSAAAARSMVGVKPDGTLVICMNDGRGANNSVGFCNYEEGEAMLALGCQWAANCDGGGSSTFITKRVGEDDFTMRSVPCDGAQRPTAHGIFVASNVAPTGILDVVNVNADYDIFAPKTVYSFSAEAIDTHGYAMDMPADAAWALSDSSFGTIENGKFVSNGTKGDVDVQIVSGGKVVGSKTITVADPAVFKLSATSTVVPYTTADKVRTITLPIVAMTGEANVYVDTNAISVALSNNAAGILDGFNFTATDDTSIAGVTVTVTYNDISLNYEIEFGKGSEVIYDFEDGDRAGFMGFEEAKKWSIDNGVNNTLVGNNPLAGQFNEYLSSDTFTTTAEQGGQVRNGNYALAWKLDNSDAAFASWSYNVLFNVGETIVLRDVANGKKAITLGMWIYIPENAFSSGDENDYSKRKGLALQSQFYVKNEDGTYTCKQNDFMFTSAATGKQTNLNSATNADIPESRWVYATVDISKYDYLCTPVADETTNSRSPSFLRTYVKPVTADEITFYIDDITLDYSSAVDDRVLPTITAPTYATSDTAVALDNGTVINGNKIAFSATVADNAALDLTSGKIFVDGIAVSADINGSMLSSKEDVVLVAGTHTVVFEVKDELGNPAKLTRTFTVAGDAVVELGGHNYLNKFVEVGKEDEDKTLVETDEPDIKAQSVYYVDINVADLAQVTKLVAQIKLHNANKWETKGAFVADGFEATFAYNEISEILTVTVEMVDAAKAKALSNTLVSIPVRVWTFDRYSYVTNTYYAIADMGNKPVVNVEAEIVYGEITLADKTTSGFGGAINVATELTTISSPYHVHDAELTVLNKEATSTETGYENRTYCETCKSVVDWGTIIPKVEITHNYEIVDGKFVCTDEGCGLVYESGTGVFEMNGKTYYSIANKLMVGWQFVDGFYYYFDNTTYEGINGERFSGDICSTSQKFYYSFTNGKLDSGVWLKMAEGTRYYYGAGHYGQGTYVIDGKTYGFNSKGYRYEGLCVIRWNPKSQYTLFEYTEEGVYVGQVYANGVFTTSNGDIYYLTDGIASMAGLVQDENGDYYFFGHGYMTARRNGTYYIAESVTNGLLPAGSYRFGADGKMLQGIAADENGKIRYYVDGKPAYAGLVQDENGDYYYISGSTMAAVTNGTYNVSKSNGLLPAGSYRFGADGKMLQGIAADENGNIRYYVDGKPAYAGLVQDENGDFYYISGSTMAAITNRTYNVSKTNGLLPAGSYRFGADGKMLQGIVKEDGKVMYYVNGKPAYAGLVRDTDGSYYYISGSTLSAVTNTTRYISFTNDLVPEGTYSFGADGKMITKVGVVKDTDGNIRYYVDGKPTYAGLVQDTDGSYYYISGSSLTAIVNTTRYITFTNGLLPEGTYKFGTDGKMIIG